MTMPLNDRRSGAGRVSPDVDCRRRLVARIAPSLLIYERDAESPTSRFRLPITAYNVQSTSAVNYDLASAA